MPPLIQKWNALKDEDKDLFPLLEVCKFLPVQSDGSASLPVQSDESVSSDCVPTDDVVCVILCTIAVPV